MKKSLGPRTLALPTPVWVVGTYDANDQPNVMTAAWGGICLLEITLPRLSFLQQ